MRFHRGWLTSREETLGIRCGPYRRRAHESRGVQKFAFDWRQGSRGSGHTSRLRIDFRQFVGDDGSKVAGLRGPGSPAQILVRMWTKGRSRLAESILRRKGDGKGRYLVWAETKGHSHRQMDARDPGVAVGATRQTAILCCPKGHRCRAKSRRRRRF